MKNTPKWQVGKRLKVRTGTLAGRTGKVTNVDFFWGEWWYVVRINHSTHTRGPEQDYDEAEG